MTSQHITARRRVVATAVVALALCAGASSHAAARPIDPAAQPGPPILSILSAADRRALQRVEAQKSDRWAYRLLPGARYSSVEMDLFAAEGI